MELTQLKSKLRFARKMYKNFLYHIPVMLGARIIELKLSDGFNLNYVRNCHIAQAISQEAFEKEEIKLVLNALTDTKVFLNIGANTGLYSIIAMKKGVNSVYAIEPSIANVKIMKKNMQLNNAESIHIYQCGVGKTKQTMMLYRDPKYPKLETHYTFVKDGKNPEDEISNVEIYTMDQIIDKTVGQNTTGLLIVIDVEGFESEVLGGWRKLSELPLGTRIMMEITRNVEDYIIKFEKCGYQLIFNSGSKNHNDLRIRDGNLFFVKSDEHRQALRIN